MNGFIDDLREQWVQVVNDGEVALANLAQAEQDLLASRDLAYNDPTDWEEWQSQYAKISTLQSTVESLQSAVNTVRGWLDSASTWLPGLSGVAIMGAQRAASKSDKLGAVPVIAGLTVAGMIALVTKISLVAAAAAAFVTYLYAKRDKAGLQQEQTQFYIEQGLPPEKAAEQARRDVTTQAQQETGYQLTAGINKVFLYGGVAMIALTMLPDLIRKVKK